MSDDITYDNSLFLFKIDTIVLLYILYIKYEDPIISIISDIYNKFKNSDDNKPFFLGYLYTTIMPINKEEPIIVKEDTHNSKEDNSKEDNSKEEPIIPDKFNKRSLCRLKRKYKNVMIELDLVVNKRKEIHNVSYFHVMCELLSKNRGLFGSVYFTRFTPDLKRVISVIKNEPIMINDSISPVSSKDNLITSFFGENTIMMRSGTPTCEKDWEVCSIESDYTSEEIDIE
jgi:hypothetical protein